MKDPLFNDESGHPYELLGVASSATPDEINLAYRRGFAGPNRVQLRTAQSILLDPRQRVLVDVFDLDDDMLRRLIGAEPSASSLIGAERRKVSQRWWAIQKDAFPDLQASHGLAVLFYWWANAEEDAFLQAASSAQGRGGLEQATCKADVMRILGTSAGPDASASAANTTDELWRWAIAHWALLMEWDQFWQNWTRDRRDVYGEIDGDFSNTARAAVAAKIESRLRHLADRNRALGATERANRLHTFELAFTNERSVGRKLAQLKAGVQTKQGAIACGRLMLELLGAVDTVRGHLGRQLEREKDNLELQTTWLRLSEHGHILMLLDRKDWKGALDLLERLPEKSRKSPEVSELLARALCEEAAHCALQDDTAAAVERWKRALAQTRFNGLKKAIEDAVIGYCNKRVAVLQGTDLAQAFKVVEDARAIVGGKVLDTTLSHLHVLRSDQRYQSAAKASQAGGGMSDIEREIRDCIDDLKQAVSLDPKNEQASRQLREREEELDSLLAPADIASRLGKDPSIADLTAEIDKLEAKSAKGPGEQHILAQLFNARAVATLNGASKAVEDGRAQANRNVNKLFRWAWFPRIPFYLLPLFVLYFYYRTRNGPATLYKTELFWGIFFLVWWAVRIWLKSLKPVYGMPSQLLFCKICARWADPYDLPGRSGYTNLCSKHIEKVNSILQDGVTSAVHWTAWSAGRDVHRALKLWPDFSEAKATLAAVAEMDPNAATESGFLSPENERVMNVIDDFMAPRPEDEDRWEPVECPRCNGQGECSLCLGKRIISAFRLELRMRDKPDVPILCLACDGSRVQNGFECYTCHGTGMQDVPRKEFQRLLRKPYARPFSKYSGVREWEHGILVGLVLGPFTSRHIKRLEVEREKVMNSLLRGDQDFQGMRLGAFSAYVAYGLCIVDYFLRNRITIAAAVTGVVLVLWLWLFWTTRRSFRH